MWEAANASVCRISLPTLHNISYGGEGAQEAIRSYLP